MAESEKPSFPNAERRKECWEARDNFFRCLDKNSDDMTKCAPMKQAFDDHCSKTWVKYFIRRREFLKYKDDVQKNGYVATEEDEKT